MKKSFIVTILLLSFCLPAFARGNEPGWAMEERHKRELDRLKQDNENRATIRDIEIEQQKKDRLRDESRAITKGMGDAAIQRSNAAIQKFENELAHYRSLDAQGQRRFRENMSAADRQNFEAGLYGRLSKQAQSELYPTLSPGAKKYVDDVVSFGQKTFGAQWINYEFSQLSGMYYDAQIQERLRKVDEDHKEMTKGLGGIANQVNNLTMIANIRQADGSFAPPPGNMPFVFETPQVNAPVSAPTQGKPQATTQAPTQGKPQTPVNNAGNAKSTALPPAFIALSESRMAWIDALTYCQQQGGRLPRLNNSDSWGDGKVTIDGFGTRGVPWPSGLPNDRYWTGTEVTGSPDTSWIISAHNDSVVTLRGIQNAAFRVACVPANQQTAATEARRVEEITRRKAEEAARKAEGTRKAEGARKITFIAQSESPMTWSEAKAFCRQRGGRLPRVNNSDSWATAERIDVRLIHVDGFGAYLDPWPSGLPGSNYWTGTEYPDAPGRSWFVHNDNGSISVPQHLQSNAYSVVCIP